MFGCVRRTWWCCRTEFTAVKHDLGHSCKITRLCFCNKKKINIIQSYTLLTVSLSVLVFKKGTAALLDFSP